MVVGATGGFAAAQLDQNWYHALPNVVDASSEFAVRQSDGALTGQRFNVSFGLRVRFRCGVSEHRVGDLGGDQQHAERCGQEPQRDQSVGRRIPRERDSERTPPS